MSEKSNAFGNFKVVPQTGQPADKGPARKKWPDYLLIVSALVFLSVVFWAGHYMGVEGVMHECQSGGGSWLAVIEHHGKTIACKRDE